MVNIREVALSDVCHCCHLFPWYLLSYDVHDMDDDHRASFQLRDPNHVDVNAPNEVFLQGSYCNVVRVARCRVVHPIGEFDRKRVGFVICLRCPICPGRASAVFHLVVMSRDPGRFSLNGRFFFVRVKWDDENKDLFGGRIAPASGAGFVGARVVFPVCRIAYLSQAALT